jgi:E3 ubiquitin-protein ligase SIAH1
MSNIRLKEGFNFIRLDDDQGTAATRQCLFLLDVKHQALSRAISVLLIHPHATVSDQRQCLKKMKCEVMYSQIIAATTSRLRGDLVTEHEQKSKFIVTCTDLSNGLPNPDERFQFVVPNFVLSYDEKDAINIGFQIQLLR